MNGLNGAIDGANDSVTIVLTEMLRKLRRSIDRPGSSVDALLYLFDFSATALCRCQINNSKTRRRHVRIIADEQPWEPRRMWE